MTTLERMPSAARDTVTTFIVGCVAAGAIGATTDRQACRAIVDDRPRLIRSWRLRAASLLRDGERAPRELG
jgi:hypothetical protein